MQNSRRSIHLFKIRGRLTIENITFKRNWFWDVLEINWYTVDMTLNGNDIDLTQLSGDPSQR